MNNSSAPFTVRHDAQGEPAMPRDEGHETAGGDHRFLCNVRADWLPIDGREALGEPQATVSFTAEQLKRDGIRGLYRVRGYQQ